MPPQIELIKGIIERIVAPPPVPGEPTPIELPFRMEWGEFQTPEAKPYRITFSQPFADLPSVQCAGSARVGEVKPPVFVPYEFRPLRVTAPVLEIPVVPSVVFKVPSIEAPTIPAPPTVRTPTFEKPTVDVPTVSIPSVPTVDIATLTIPLPALRAPTFVAVPIPSLLELMRSLRSTIIGLLDELWPHAWPCARVGLLEARRTVEIIFHDRVATVWSSFFDTIKRNIETSIRGLLSDVDYNIKELVRWGRDDIKGRIEAAFSDARAKVMGSFSGLKSEVDSKLGATKTSIEGTMAKTKREIEEKIGRTFDSILACWRDIVEGMRAIEVLKPEVEGKVGRTFKSIYDSSLANKEVIEKAFTSLKSEVDTKMSKWISETIRITDGFNYTFEAMTAEALKGLKHTTEQAHKAVVESIKGLYAMLGVRTGVFVTPVAIKEVTKEYFTIEGVLSNGCPGRFWWFAIGPR